MNTSRRAGFTLIELLTVIAIIAILASMTAVMLPRALERAKVTRVKGALNQINIAATQYYTEHSSNPPTYGYKVPRAASNEQFLTPYTSFLRMYNNQDLYDEFSSSYDTDNNELISLLEFSPIAVRPNPAIEQYVFPVEIYNGANLPDQVAAQLNTDPRPFVYVPVNSRQAIRVKRYWVESNDFMAETWDRDHHFLQELQFPPDSYDKYALISVGPGGSTGGILDHPPFLAQIANEVPLADIYHILALRAYYLATRDLNNNNLLDFEFEARATQGEGRAVYQVNSQTVENATLPNGTQGYGPLIYMSN